MKRPFLKDLLISWLGGYKVLFIAYDIKSKKVSREDYNLTSREVLTHIIDKKTKITFDLKGNVVVEHNKNI